MDALICYFNAFGFCQQCSTVQAFCAGLQEQLQLYQERLASVDVRKALPIPGESDPQPSTRIPTSTPGRTQLTSDAGDSDAHGRASVQSGAVRGERKAEGGVSASEQCAFSSTEYITMAKLDLLVKQWQGRMTCLAWTVAECR